ncbi:MAG: small basic protein [Candidatus Omnitrophota bacterium]|nr:small basic protein [Candidatus Omnitrophota bacterium]
MSLHPSLKTSKAGKKHRTVLKRYERLAVLKEKGILKDDDSVFGMPKLKIVRIKIKKEVKEEKPEGGEVAAATAAPASATAATKAAPKAAGKTAGKEEKKK